LVRAHIFVSGYVQGVFYRSTAKRIAERLGIKGWVKNLTDGRVEAVFEGPKEDVLEMIEWCKKGPLDADVESVELSWEKNGEGFVDFEILY
jgi:acylphosphatase